MKRRSSSRLSQLPNTLKAAPPPIQKKSDNKSKRATYEASDDGYSTGYESEIGSVDDYIADEAYFDNNDFLPRKRIASMKTIKALRDVREEKKEQEEEEDDDEEVNENDESDDEEESENETSEKRASRGRSQRRKRDTQGKDKSQKQRSKEVYDVLEQKRRYFAMIDKHELVIEKM